jgi:KGK domain
MNENPFETLGPKDVLKADRGSFNEKSEEMIETVASFLLTMGEPLSRWPYVGCLTMSDGVPVTVLKESGGGWQKGKLRMRVVVEFEPEPQLKVEQPSHDH